MALALANASSASAQQHPEASISADEEVIVRGQRLSDLRLGMEAARVRVYDVFNAVNSDDAFDVHCRYEETTGTRMRQHICRPRFRTTISNSAARAWRYGLISACGGVTQACIFSEAAQQAISMAQAEAAREGDMQRRFELEMARAVLEHPELREAMLEYAATEQAYLQARGRNRD